jgi:hypothetical protein
MVPAQVTMLGERRRSCMACGCVRASKGHYTATFRSLFGDVPLRVRCLLACPCQGSGATKSFAVLDVDVNKEQQTEMRSNRATVRPFLGVRTAVLNDTLKDAFRHRYPGFRPANNDEATAAVA